MFTRRLIYALLAGALALCLGVATAVASSPHTNIANGVETQTEAGPQVFTPSSTPCTETVAADDTFDNSYYAPDLTTYNPGACPGPWSKVVMTVTGDVSGSQYDRLLEVEIGNAIVLHGSTTEPDGLVLNTDSAIEWSVQRDVTQDSALLTSQQPVEVSLDNVTNTTVTGIYNITVKLTFYPATASGPATDAPNVVLPMANNTGGEPMFELTNCNGVSGETASQQITFPRNLDRLQAELFASGGGPKEEFWWTDPEGDGEDTSAYREIDVYIDGKLAGAAPVYPSTFTGFQGPDLWEPIPSPRAWDLVPYDVDLTPFIGELSDGLPHDITLGVANAAFADDACDSSDGPDYWKVAANFDGWTDPTASITGGLVTPELNSSAPTEVTSTDPTGQDLYYTDQASHDLTFAGTVDTGAGIDKVTVNDDMAENADETPVTEEDNWNWDEASTTTLPSGTVTTLSDDHTYSASAQELEGDYAFTDDDAQDDTSGSKTTFTSTTAETMQTQDALGEGGAVAAGTQADVEDECWDYSDSTGLTYDQQIVAAGGEVLSSNSQSCMTLPTLASIVDPFTTTTGTTTTGTTTTTTTGTSTTGTTPADTVTSSGQTVTAPGGTVTTLGQTVTDTQVITKTKTKPKPCTPSARLSYLQHPAYPVRETIAVVAVDGKHVRTVRGQRIIDVVLARPKATRFTLTLTATLSSGEIVRHTYRYDGCKVTSTVTVLRRAR